MSCSTNGKMKSFTNLPGPPARYNHLLAKCYIKRHESTNTSYVKVGERSKRLIVTFSSNAHKGFEKKTSLLELKYGQNIDIDILFLRSPETWYLSDLPGIGTHIDHTIEFLKKQFTMYDDVITVGSSMGGYASILLGSICKANAVVATWSQTDLDYSVKKVLSGPSEWGWMVRELSLAENGESERIPQEVYHKYKNLKDVIDPTIEYHIIGKSIEHHFHGAHHCENLSDFKHINMYTQDEENNHSIKAESLYRHGTK